MDAGPKIALVRFQNSFAADVDEPLIALFHGTDGLLHESVAGATSWFGSVPALRHGARVGPPGAAVVAFKQGPNQITALYFDRVDDASQNFAVHAKWRHRGQKDWQGPALVLLGQSSAPVGASLAVASQGANRWIAAYAGKDGNIHALKVDGALPWGAHGTVASDGVAEPGGNLLAIEQAPGLVSVLFVPKTFPRVHVCWREEHAAAWHGPALLHGSLPAAPPGAALAAARLPNDLWWVFHVDANGTLTANRVIAREQWREAEKVSAPGVAAAGAPVAAVSPTHSQVNVFVVDNNGALIMYKRVLGSPAWSGPHKLTADHFGSPRAAVSAAKQNDHVSVVTFIGVDGRPYVCWAVAAGDWHGPARVSWMRCVEAQIPDAAIATSGTNVPAPTGAIATIQLVAGTTKRLAQLTGAGTLNPLQPYGSWGTDLGANTEHSADARAPSRLYIFTGDVTQQSPSSLDDVKDKYRDPDLYPPWDGDLVAYTDSAGLEPGGFKLQVVREPARQTSYHPFTVETLGVLTSGETPTGAFSYDGRVFVFVVAASATATSYLVSTDKPDHPGTFALNWKFSTGSFWQVAPVVVRNADHPWLPSQDGDGLVMVGHGYPDVIRLAWMPLEPGKLPDRSRMLFFAGIVQGAIRPHYKWSPLEQDAIKVIDLPVGYTAVSLMWLPGPARWLLLYSLARAPWDQGASQRHPRDPIVARVAKNPAQWSTSVFVFDPDRDSLTDAQGNNIAWDPNVSWSYGAFIVNRFTRWEPARARVRIRFLLSLFEPYQIQLMEAVIQLPDVSLFRRILQVFREIVVAVVNPWLKRHD